MPNIGNYLNRKSVRRDFEQGVRREINEIQKARRAGPPPKESAAALALRVETFARVGSLLVETEPESATRPLDALISPHAYDVSGLTARVKRAEPASLPQLTDQLQILERFQRDTLNGYRQKLGTEGQETLDGVLFSTALEVADRADGSLTRTMLPLFAGTTYAWLLTQLLETHPELARPARELRDTMREVSAYSLELKRGPKPITEAQRKQLESLKEKQQEQTESLFQQPYVRQSLAAFAQDHGSTESERFRKILSAARPITQAMTKTLNESSTEDPSGTLFDATTNFWRRNVTMFELLRGAPELDIPYDMSLRARTPEAIIGDVEALLAHLTNSDHVQSAQALLEDVRKVDTSSRSSLIFWPMLETLYAERHHLQTFDSRLTALQKAASVAVPDHANAGSRKKSKKKSPAFVIQQQRLESKKRAKAHAEARKRNTALQALKPKPLTYAEVLIKGPQAQVVKTGPHEETREDAWPALGHHAAAPEGPATTSYASALQNAAPWVPLAAQPRVLNPEHVVRLSLRKNAQAQPQATATPAAQKPRFKRWKPTLPTTKVAPQNTPAAAPITFANGLSPWNGVLTHDPQQAEKAVKFWYPGTFPSPMASLEYHYDKHARSTMIGPLSVERYTHDALRAAARWKGWQAPLLDGTGMANVVRDRNDYGVYTQDGRIVTYHNRQLGD